MVATAHWYTNPAWLTVVGVLATAAFALGGLVLNYMGYIHLRDASGRRRPVRTARVEDDQFYYKARAVLSVATLPPTVSDRYRLAYIHFFNQSDSEQVIGFSPKQAKVVWPRRKRTKIEAISQSFALPPNKGGAIPLIIGISDPNGAWPDDSVRPEGDFRRRYYVKVRGKTAGQRRVKYRGRVLLTPYDADRIPAEKKD